MAALDQVMIRLHRALEAGSLPPEGHRICQRLMTQLHQPTRVAVIGLAGAGKTSLINMLLGAPLLPALEGLSAVELSYAANARFQVTLLDGTIEISDGSFAPGLLPKGAMKLSMQLPDERLKEWSFTEFGLSPTSPGPRKVLDWMAERSDLAIWCTQVFDDRERALWSQVPEHLKDHSILALTRADRLYMRGELTDRIAKLQPIVADEFLSLCPIATLQAAAARQNPAGQDEALWKSSGGKAFYLGLRQQVEQARTADLDHAHMLLQRYKVANIETDEAPAGAAPDLTVATAGKTAGNATGKAAGKAASAPTPTPTPTLAGKAVITLAKPSTAAKPATNAVIEEALGVLRGCAEELMASDTAPGAGSERILEQCSKSAGTLVELLSQSDDPAADLAALREDAIEGEQMLMLLRLERGENAAEDSLTVILQLKKELSESLAR